MPLLVQTGGPSGDAGPLPGDAALTYGDMARQLADELDDTNDFYLPQIQNAIAAAIRFCAREPFYFNRDGAAEFTARPGYACYDRADCPALAQMGAAQAVYCEAGGRVYALKAAEADEIQRLSANAIMGPPGLYGFLGAKLCLYPIPDKAYRIKLLLSPARYVDAAAPEGRLWFSEAFALIKARAKYDLYKDILQDAPLAAAAFNDFREEWAALAAETSRRRGPRNQIRATQF